MLVSHASVLSMHLPFATGAQNEQLSTDRKVSGFTKVDMSLSKNCTFMHCIISIWVHVYEWLLLMSRWCLVLIPCMCMSQFICTFCNVVVTVLIRAAVKYLHNTFFFCRQTDLSLSQSLHPVWFPAVVMASRPFWPLSSKVMTKTVALFPTRDNDTAQDDCSSNYGITVAIHGILKSF